MPAPRVEGPKPPIFHLLRLRVGVEGNANFSVPVGGNANFSVFQIGQHVGIPNAELWHWGSKTTRGPNANGFALQWNIGFIVRGDVKIHKPQPPYSAASCSQFI